MRTRHSCPNRGLGFAPRRSFARVSYWRPGFSLAIAAAGPPDGRHRDRPASGNPPQTPGSAPSGVGSRSNSGETAIGLFLRESGGFHHAICHPIGDRCANSSQHHGEGLVASPVKPSARSGDGSIVQGIGVADFNADPKWRAIFCASSLRSSTIRVSFQEPSLVELSIGPSPLQIGAGIAPKIGKRSDRQD